MASRETWLGAVNDNDIWLIDNTTTANVEYWGYAQPGSATTASVWRIIKITKDSSGLPIMKQFANGSPAYAFKYDDRAAASITYS